MSDDLTRREYLGGVAGAAFLPLSSIDSAAVDDTLTVAAARYGAFFGTSTSDLAVRFGADSRPSWIVEYSEEKKESLTEWVDADDDREKVSEHDADRTMTVWAPPSHVGVSGFPFGVGSGGLKDRGYVETIDLNLDVANAEPVDVLEGSDVWRGAHGLRESITLNIRGGSTPTEGVAFDDVDEATISDVVSYTDADATGEDGTGLTAAVIDTGVNTAGGDVFNDTTRIVDASKDFITEETVGDDGIDAIDDPNGHGSWVASCIGADPSDASFQGFLTGADIMGLRVLDADGSGSTERIARAVRYAAENGADVACLSLGSPVYSHELDRALAYAAGEGMVSDVAVGNDRQATRWVASPADVEYAIRVSAVEASPDPAETRSAYFANVGPDPGTTDLSSGETAGVGPDVAAPGMDIRAYVATENGTTTERVLSGTSMSTPAVVGVIGHLLSAESALKGETEEVRTRLMDHAVRLPRTGELEVGAGLVSAERAINQTEPDETQAEAREPSAESRDTAYRSLSAAEGGFLPL